MSGKRGKFEDDLEPGVPGAGDSHVGVAGLGVGEAAEQWAQEARRHQRTPGAYECWYFEAVSERGNGVVAALFEGLPFHPLYLSRVSRHQHRAMAGPFDMVPREAQASAYLAAYVGVYEGGRRVAQALNLYSPEKAGGETDDPAEIRIGPNRITLRQDGSVGLSMKMYPYEVKRWRPKLRRGQTLNVELNFAPSMGGGVQHVRPFRGPGADGARHMWALSCPHALVTGNIQHLDLRDGAALLDMQVHTHGYHDHTYGQGPMALGLKQMHWGYLMGDDWTAVWHHSPLAGGPRDRADGVVLMQAGKHPVVIDGPTIKMEKGPLSRWWLRVPGRVSLYGSDTQGNPAEMIIKHGKATTSAPFYARAESHGWLTIPGRGTFMGRGWSHTLKLSRLKWPVLSDLVLMAIEQVRADDPLWRE